MGHKTIRILIFGGSALGQNYLGLSNLFYKKFSHWILEEHDLKCEIHLKALRSFDMLPEIVAAKLKEKKYDFIFIQMRPGLVNMRFNFLMRKKGKRQVNFVRNPYMRKNKGRIIDAVSSDTLHHSLDNFQQKTSIREHVISSINAFLGFGFGYVERASAQINEIFSTVFELVEKENTKIYVLGIFNSVRSPLVNYIYKKMNASFDGQMSSLNGHYVDVFKEMDFQTKKGKQLFIEDQYHLSKLGHETLAIRLIEEFRITALPK